MAKRKAEDNNEKAFAKRAKREEHRAARQEVACAITRITTGLAKVRLSDQPKKATAFQRKEARLRIKPEKKEEMKKLYEGMKEKGWVPGNWRSAIPESSSDEEEEEGEDVEMEGFEGGGGGDRRPGVGEGEVGAGAGAEAGVAADETIAA